MLRERWLSHPVLSLILAGGSQRIYYKEVKDAIERFALERTFIEKFRPMYNGFAHQKREKLREFVVEYYEDCPFKIQAVSLIAARKTLREMGYQLWLSIDGQTVWL